MNIHDNIPYMTLGLPDDIRRQQLAGNYAEAIRLIDLRLAQDNLPKCLRASLVAYREMFDRLPDEYPYTKEEALAIEKAVDTVLEEGWRTADIAHGVDAIGTKEMTDKILERMN